MRQSINNEVLQVIKNDEELMFQIAQHLMVRFRTVYQWVLNNDEKLTAPAVLQIIRTKLKKEDSEILEDMSVPSL